MEEDKIIDDLLNDAIWNLSVKQAKKEHEEFTKRKGSGVMAVEDARKDKLNKSVISLSVWDDVIKLLDHIREFGEKYKSTDLKALQNLTVRQDMKLKDDTIAFLIKECKAGRGILQSIETRLIMKP